MVQTQVDELLPLKNKLDVLRKRVREVKRAITEILNSDEDMSMMQLGSPFLYKESLRSSSREEEEGAIERSSGTQFDEYQAPVPNENNPNAGVTRHPTSDGEEASDASEKQHLATMNMEMLFES